MASLTFKPKTTAQLEKMSTKNLLAYYRADRRRRDVCVNSNYADTDEYEVWREYLVKVKNILNTREHVNKKTKNGSSSRTKEVI